jgi:two-component system OmpR family sensor kinase
MRKFVSDASHELRTPLTSIQGFSQLLSNGDIESEEDKKIALDSITDESKRLTRLLNNLLLLTRLDYKIKIHKKPENIREIIDEIYQQLKYISGLRELNVHTEDVWVNSNSDQIKQIFINLVNNASQHTDKDHGKISIVLKNAVINEIRYGVIIVSDNGIGIPEEKLSKIFDRFYRVESHRSRKNGGFGLGLSIVKSIVDENDGKIQVESQVGHGSKFTIYFKAIDVSKEILS